MLSNPKIIMIAAISRNKCIGKCNKIPWSLPDDLKHFKNITTGHPVIMGRKTYESLPAPLSNRTNIVLTNDVHYRNSQVLIANSYEHALDIAFHCQGGSEIMIIGGEQVYKQFMPVCTTMYLTQVDTYVDGDVFFPQIDLNRFCMVDCTKWNRHNNLLYRFTKWDRINKM